MQGRGSQGLWGGCRRLEWVAVAWQAFSGALRGLQEVGMGFGDGRGRQGVGRGVRRFRMFQGLAWSCSLLAVLDYPSPPGPRRDKLHALVKPLLAAVLGRRRLQPSLCPGAFKAAEEVVVTQALVAGSIMAPTGEHAEGHARARALTWTLCDLQYVPVPPAGGELQRAGAGVGLAVGAADLLLRHALAATAPLNPVQPLHLLHLHLLLFYRDVIQFISLLFV